MSREIKEILLEVLIIVVMVCFNVTVGQITVKTEYSKKEQFWVCEVMTLLTIEIAGFTLFRAAIMGLASSARQFTDFLIYLVIYQI